jgi:hypothetical protein
MGLLRRPTPGEIVEGGRLCRPYGPGAHSHFQKINLGLRRQSTVTPTDGLAYGPNGSHVGPRIAK